MQVLPLGCARSPSAFPALASGLRCVLSGYGVEADADRFGERLPYILGTGRLCIVDEHLHQRLPERHILAIRWRRFSEDFVYQRQHALPLACGGGSLMPERGQRRLHGPLPSAHGKVALAHFFLAKLRLNVPPRKIRAPEQCPRPEVPLLLPLPRCGPRLSRVTYKCNYFDFGQLSVRHHGG
ncbi:hypothetical protein CBM2629_A60148 [Cupriavidus taiwanensis]|nr:hypothetical protein CBM2629_A60148 [Cupriavidus taiwanensis]